MIKAWILWTTKLFNVLVTAFLSAITSESFFYFEYNFVVDLPHLNKENDELAFTKVLALHERVFSLNGPMP